jgi:CubicO group peptidase (beta-lactamase class C family)
MKRFVLIVGLVVGLTPGARSAEPAKPLLPVLQSLVDDHIVAGAVVLVADKDRVLEITAVGEADIVAHQPMPENAVFWIASMSKSLTGTALMMLVNEGKLSLDDAVEKYLPVFKGQQIAGSDGTLHAPKHPITVREIMCHTSGLVLASDKALKQTHSLKDDVTQYAARPLRQEPGTKYEYNNCGINTSGRLIEIVSGMSYAEFMQTRLFDPLGMKDTTCWPNEEQAKRLAHTARRNGERPDPNMLEQIKQDRDVPRHVIEKWSEGVPVPAAVTADMGAGIAFDYARRYAMPAGGYFSTAQDLGRFCRMLLRGGELDGRRYLSERAVRELSAIQTREVPVNPQEAYGVGVSVKIRDEEGPSVGSFGHRGARRTVMWIDPTNQLATVLLVERFDMSGEEQKRMYGTVMKTAIEKYGAAAAAR